MQGPFLLADKMQDVDKTIHKKHKGCSVATEKPFSFPGNSCCLQQESHSNNATFQKKIQLVHSSIALNYNTTDFCWESET